MDVVGTNVKVRDISVLNGEENRWEVSLRGARRLRLAKPLYNRAI